MEKNHSQKSERSFISQSCCEFFFFLGWFILSLSLSMKKAEKKLSSGKICFPHYIFFSSIISSFCETYKTVIFFVHFISFAHSFPFFFLSCMLVLLFFLLCDFSIFLSHLISSHVCWDTKSTFFDAKLQSLEKVFKILKFMYKFWVSFISSNKNLLKTTWSIWKETMS